MNIRLTWLWIAGLLLLGLVYILVMYQSQKNESTMAMTSSNVYKVTEKSYLPFEESFHQAVDKHFPSRIVDKAFVNQNMGAVQFEQADSYFESEDKLSRIFSIEMVNIFREVDGLEKINVKIPFEGRMYVLNVNREIIESHFGELSAVSDSEWSRRIKEFDNVMARKIFFNRYVSVQ